MKLQSRSLMLPKMQSSGTRSIRHPDGRPLRVYTDIPHVEEYLTHPEFAISKFNAYLLELPLNFVLYSNS